MIWNQEFLIHTSKRFDINKNFSSKFKKNCIKKFLISSKHTATSTEKHKKIIFKEFRNTALSFATASIEISSILVYFAVTAAHEVITKTGSGSLRWSARPDRLIAWLSVSLGSWFTWRPLTSRARHPSRL